MFIRFKHVRAEQVTNAIENDLLDTYAEVKSVQLDKALSRVDIWLGTGEHFYFPMGTDDAASRLYDIIRDVRTGKSKALEIDAVAAPVLSIMLREDVTSYDQALRNAYNYNTYRSYPRPRWWSDFAQEDVF